MGCKGSTGDAMDRYGMRGVDRGRDKLDGIQEVDMGREGSAWDARGPYGIRKVRMGCEGLAGDARGRQEMREVGM